MFSTTSIFLLSLLNLVLAAPTTSPTATTTTPACASGQSLPTDVAPYFYLKTNTLLNPSSPKNNLYLSNYHVEAGDSVAVLVNENATEFTPTLAYLNDTYLQFAIQLLPPSEGGSIYWYLLFGTNADEVASPQMVSVFGGDGAGGAGYYFNDTDGSGRTGLKFEDELFVGWLACDWFGTAGNVQLLPQFSFYWEGGDVAGLGSDGVLPANCEAVELVQDFAC